MHWESASAFFAMGGHGFWVWMAWGMALAAVILKTFSSQSAARRHLTPSGALNALKSNPSRYRTRSRNMARNVSRKRF